MWFSFSKRANVLYFFHNNFFLFWKKWNIDIRLHLLRWMVFIDILTEWYSFDSITGATVVSWRVNNQEQLFVRWVNWALNAHSFRHIIIIYLIGGLREALIFCSYSYRRSDRTANTMRRVERSKSVRIPNWNDYHICPWFFPFVQNSILKFRFITLLRWLCHSAIYYYAALA